MELSGYNPVTSFNPGNNSFVLLTFPVNLLKPDSKYRFKLTVNEGSEEGEASLVVHVRAGPTTSPSAGLSVSPISVQALDVVTLSGESVKENNEAELNWKKYKCMKIIGFFSTEMICVTL